MMPPVGSSRPSTSFAVVVLPQPDSPTTPRVCPGSIANEMPSTARTTPRSPPKIPRLARKCLVSPAASTTAIRAAPLSTRRSSRIVASSVSEPAARVRPVSRRERRRRLGAAPVEDLRAARRERAARRQCREIRRLAVDRGKPLAVVAHPRDRVQQGLGIGMGRSIEDLRHRPQLDHPPGIHHRELVAHLGDDAEIVGDEDQSEAMLALQVAQQVQVLRLDRQIEAGGRLVGDQQARLARDADGADDALAHAARHLVRVLRDPRLRRRDAHRLQKVDRPAPGGGARGALMHPDRLGDLVADREQRVQRGHRVLQDHRDALAAHMPHLLVGFEDEIFALEQHLAADDPGGRRQDAHDRQGQRALAGARIRRRCRGSRRH